MATVVHHPMGFFTAKIVETFVESSNASFAIAK